MPTHASVESLIQHFEQDQITDVLIEDEKSDYTESVLQRANPVNWYDTYATKKTFSNGLLNGAVLSTNAAQLRTLLSAGFYNLEDPKWYISISLVTSSIFFQILMLILSGVLANNHIGDKKKARAMDIINNIILVLTGVIFSINIVVNVFVQIDLTGMVIGNNSKPNFEELAFVPITVPHEFWSSSSTVAGALTKN